MKTEKKGKPAIAKELAALRRKVKKMEKTESKLLEERFLLRALIDSIPDAMYAKDLSCKKIIANPADVHNMGLTSESDVLGKDDFDLYPKKIAEGFYADDQSVIRTGTPVLNREELFLDAKEGKRWLATSKLPLKDEYGTITGIIGIGRDITERKNAEEALQREKRLMDGLMESVPDSIYFKDRQCRLLKISRKMLNDLNAIGITDAVGKNDVELFGEKFGRQTLEDDEQMMALGTPIVALTESRQLEDGSLYWTSTTKVPLRDDQDQIVGLVGITREINELMRAQNELAFQKHYLESLVEGSPTAIVTLNRDERIQTCNKAFKTIFGYSADDAVGKNLDELVVPDKEKKEGRKLTLSSFYKESIHRELTRKRKDGSLVEVEVHAKSIDMDEKQVGVVAQYVDITERKRAEEQIRQQLSVIEQQNFELEKARDLAMEANKTKSAFLASMSHELRTPLNAIIGYSEMIIEEMSDDGETRYHGDLDRIHAAGKNLLELINEVLDLSKIEAGKMELYVEEFQLSDLIDEVVSTVQPLTEKNENSLVVNAAKDIQAVRLDHTKVRQILFNLISNASKFTQKGTITLTAAAIPANERASAAIVLKVSDTGIGLTEEQKSRLFKEFSQADNSTTRKYGGTGLGLSITKHFTEMMHGSIAIESTPNNGTTFTVTLPRSIESTGEKTSTAASLEKKSTSPITTKTAVLVIDDDPGVRDLLMRYLSKEGYLVECVISGDDGIKRAREILPMAIILDVMMPRKDGWAVLQEIKNDPLLNSIPIIMYTMLDEKNFGLAIGASEYLLKPVSKERIVEVLQKYKRRTPGEYILVVDDNADLRAMASRAIQKAGWKVRTAENGRSAITHLENELPSIIFLDIMMPVMDGFEFLTIFQNRSEWKDIPVVVITSKDLIAEERQQLGGAVKKVIQKGEFTPEKLLKQISYLIPQLIIQQRPHTGSANG